MNPQFYGMKIVVFLAGCFILGFGVTKIVFDVSMSVIAAILSFAFAQQLNGIREGTLIAALLVGYIARTIGKIVTAIHLKEEQEVYNMEELKMKHI